MVLKRFHVKYPLKLYAFGRQPPSQNVLFQGPPHKQRLELKMFALKYYTHSKICTNCQDFSKIAALQAHSVARSDALVACISAIFE